MVKAAFALAAALLCIACDKTPTAPTPGPGPEPGPPVVRRLELAGPDVVPLGESSQFRLTALLSDGSSRDVTNEARWRPGPAHVLDATSNPGVIAGLERGEGVVIAEFGEGGVPENRATKRVLVLPAGTYRLMGTVMEAGAPSGPVLEALVEATTVSGIHMTTHTDSLGQFVFYGVSGETRLRVTKAGYQIAARTTIVTDQTTYDVELPLVAPRADVSGNYTLTMTAASECGAGLGKGNLPEEARVRTYQAAIQQHGPQLEMTLTGATLRSRPISGRVEPGRVVFNLGWTNESDTDERQILERLATSGFLAIGGSASATVSPNRLSGTLYGEFSIFETESIWIRPIAECSSERHQFALSR